MLKPPESEILPTRSIEKEGLNVASEIVKLNQIDMRGSTHEVDRYSQYQLPPVGRKALSYCCTNGADVGKCFCVTFSQRK
jgi:hypothetical protein